MIRLLDGREIAGGIKSEVKDTAGSLADKPCLAIVLTTADKSTRSYVGAIVKAAEATGLKAAVSDLGEDVDQADFLAKIKDLSRDENIHGIIIQTPLGKNLDSYEARMLIAPEKDVDGASILSAGKLFSSQDVFAPATAQAVIEILRYYDIDPAGKHAVVIGRSQIVGKPVAQMLLDQNATVTVCHSKTEDLSSFTTTADILVAAAGKPGLINKSHLDPARKTVVIDVGTNVDEFGRLTGDVNFDEIKEIAGSITPVPGGVGPVTTAILLKNTLSAYQKITGKNP